MAEKCPVCGAPMQSHICDYCGYIQKAEAAPVENTKEISQNLTKSETRQQETQHSAQQIIQQVIQPQVIIREVPVYERIAAPQISRKSRWTALVLCLFFEYLGAHRFYTGKIGTGLIYLCTMGGFGIGWFLDIIRIAVGAFRDEFDLPLKK